MLYQTSVSVEKAWRRLEFYGLIIYGRQGIGKSTYALKVAHDLYQDWDLVFKYLVFSVDDLIDVMKKAQRERIKLIVWDDAGVHGHKYLYFRRKDAVELISAWVDVVRTRLAGWLITTPDPRNLLKPVRESPGFYYGKVVRYNSGRKRLVKVYERVYLPSGDITVRKVYYDVFEARLPDDVYKQYMDLRRAFYEEAEEKLMEYIQEREAGE